LSLNLVSANSEETKRITERYERRIKQGLIYPMSNPEVYLNIQERERGILRLLSKRLTIPWDTARLFEIGCGDGGNLLNFIRYGFTTDLIVGNELIEERVAAATKSLPSRCKIIAGDALMIKADKCSFDIVFQSMVFTSILDTEFRNKLALKMWEWVSPGGGVLWYDFIYNNPNNPDVKGVPLREIRDLFPEGDISYEKITLAPPIARRIVKLHPSLYHVFNFMPLLRTHVLCWIEKKK